MVNNKSTRNMLRTLIVMCVVAAGVSESVYVYADDTEVYQTTRRPKVLIVIDDSGSMASSVPGDTRTRMAVAQDVISTIIRDNDDVDFGIMEFNANWSNPGTQHGSRVVQAILADMTDAQRTAAIGKINQMTAAGSTPMCESAYEAYRYLAGETILYGYLDDGTDSRAGDILARDAAAENSDSPVTYKTPATDCYTYVVLMTDGYPQNDTDANQRIKDLIGRSTMTCTSYTSADRGGSTENCLPELAEHMATVDLNNTGGLQLAITYTIGFGFDNAQALLTDTATRGGGDAYVANSTEALTQAFAEALKSIKETNASFTSPSVAVDSFTRTQSRDDVFFSMFKPVDATDEDEEFPNDWPGNIKKLKIALDTTVDPHTATLVDKNTAAAIDPTTGEIKETASTYWSTNDGGEVEAGGVGGLLVTRTAARVIKTNTGTTTGAILQAFNSTNLTAAAYDMDCTATDTSGYDAELFAMFCTNQADLGGLINWGLGKDLDGTAVRDWVLGDMLHSKPLIVNYGALGSATIADPDLRIVVGTNSGFFHMFGNDDGHEDWAFFPKELATLLQERSQSAISSSHVYGIDGSPVLYLEDADRDGAIDVDVNADDKAWVYFGLRRGGRMMYALDISDPDDPGFLWKVDSSTSGFGELGQTWSTPVLAKIPGYVDSNDKRKPVLIFGAGYDPVKDGAGLVGDTTDTMGRGLYIVDAEDGTLVWSVTPGSDSATNLQEAGLVHSVPGVVSPVDSNGDQLIDRIYFGDTGGNVWRVDLPGNCLPSDSTCQSDVPPPPPWSIVKLASLNGGTVATDRRFFNAPDVVRTTYGGLHFDAVLIGSGDRTNPNGTDVNNQFYMLRDQRTLPYFDDKPADCSDPTVDFRCELPLTVGDLYNVTPNLAEDVDPDVQAQAAIDIAAADGWRLDLNQASGEKSLSRSLTIDGKVYFGSYSPNTNVDAGCYPIVGAGRLYVINLFNAIAERDFDGDNDKERSWIIGYLIPDTPSPHFGADGEIRLLLPPGSGGGGALGNPFLTGATLPDPYGSYWYREEY